MAVLSERKNALKLSKNNPKLRLLAKVIELVSRPSSAAHLLTPCLQVLEKNQPTSDMSLEILNHLFLCDECRPLHGRARGRGTDRRGPCLVGDLEFLPLACGSSAPLSFP